MPIIKRALQDGTEEGSSPPPPAKKQKVDCVEPPETTAAQSLVVDPDEPFSTGLYRINGGCLFAGENEICEVPEEDKTYYQKVCKDLYGSSKLVTGRNADQAFLAQSPKWLSKREKLPDLICDKSKYAEILKDVNRHRLLLCEEQHLISLFSRSN